MVRILSAALAALILLPATANAATRYASSTSTVTTGACDTPANACKLSYAVQGATVSDDVIVLSDGAYALDGPLFSPARTISGEAGKPRPVIQDTAAQPQLMAQQPGQAWTHLDLRVPVSASGLLEDVVISQQLAAGETALSVINGATVRQVSVSATSETSGARAVAVFSTLASVRVAETTVHITAPNAVAVDVVGGPPLGGRALTLRGVTAVGAGSGSRGLVVTGTASEIPGGPGVPPLCFGSGPGVDVVDSILRGEAADVAAIFNNGCTTPPPPTRVTLKSSNVRADKLTTDGTTAVIDSSDPANQLTPALTDNAAILVDFAGGNLHQREGAPTIDAGSGVDAAQVDVDGELRDVSGKADIGGDESQVATVAGGSASDVTTASATLGAAVAAADGDSSVVFEYGTTTDYGSSTAPVSLEPQLLQQPAVAVTGLTPATTYHFRAVVTTTSQGATRTATGPDRTFTTPAAPASGGGGGAGGGGTGAGGGGATPGIALPPFVARGLKAPSSLSLRTFTRHGLSVSLQVGVLGSKIAAGLFTGGTTARAAQATRPLVSKTVSNTGTVTVTLKASKAALKRLRKLKSITLRVTVTPPAASGAKPVTLTKKVKLKS